MSANTTPDGIVYPVSTDQVSPLETVFANMANSIQTAFNTRGTYNYRWANAAARTAQTGMRNGDYGFQIDTNAQYRYMLSNWMPTNPTVRMYRNTGTPNDYYFGPGGTAFFPMDVVSFNDSTALYDTTTNNGRVTVKQAGVYQITGRVRYGADGNTGLRDATIKINGTQISESGGYTNNAVVISLVTDTLRLNANDVISISGYSDAGTVVRSATAGSDVTLTVTYIGS